MSTPTIISRYPRPLKATQTFQPTQQSGTSSSLHHSPLTSSSSSSSIRSTSHKSPPFTETLSPFSSSHDIYKDTQFIMSEEFNKLSCSPCQSPVSIPPPRRATSLDSLHDDSTQSEESIIIGQELMEQQVQHKRSNSCSNADAITKFHNQSCSKVDHHTRKSIEGINQEISSVFEGKSITHMLSYPDGHIAPVHDLSFSAMSPQEDFLSSPLSSPMLWSNGTSTSIDYRSFVHSPKQSFAHTPPPNVERCKIVQETFMGNTVSPRPPDQSKANIVFNGTVFAPPLLPSHSLKAVPII